MTDELVWHRVVLFTYVNWIGFLISLPLYAT